MGFWMSKSNQSRANPGRSIHRQDFTYVTNHKFGLVGVIADENGKTAYAGNISAEFREVLVVGKSGSFLVGKSCKF